MADYNSQQRARLNAEVAQRKQIGAYTQAPMPVRPANVNPNTVTKIRQTGGPGPLSGIRAGYNATLSSISQTKAPVNVPKGLPTFLGNRQLIIAMWIVAMIVIGFDEWHNLGILPRPSRLWYSSVVYGGLAILGIADAMVPIANAFAVGFTIMLIYQFYNSSGQFTGTPTKFTNPTKSTTSASKSTTTAGVTTP